MLLSIHDLQASVNDQPILKGVNLDVAAGSVHAIMGPNGSGKSTLTKVLLGHDEYRHDGGTMHLDGEDLSELEAEERARKGLFVGFQYPVEVPGVANLDFLRLAWNAQNVARGGEEMDSKEFRSYAEERLKTLGMDPDLLERDLNSGFSGGQKKRNEILQMFVLEPKMAILDETDSGLDVDALRAVADGINAYRSPDRGILLITHYQRLLDLVHPDVVHIFADGHIVKSGDSSLAAELEAKGYDEVMQS
ncbi:MAG: Fe-S cluster assembly ATPase SufC [Planctomycetota bacterium]|nr:MAG: Fe-S cluster assembly ATPase SufC [Planctomycetota bacterium]